MNQDNFLDLLKVQDAFDTPSWEGRSEEDKMEYAKIVSEKFPRVIIHNIIKTSWSLMVNKPFVILDCGEIFLGIKKDRNPQFLINTTLEAINGSKNAIIFFKTKKPLAFDHFRKLLDSKNINYWNFCTIPAEKELIDAIIFK